MSDCPKDSENEKKNSARASWEFLLSDFTVEEEQNMKAEAEAEADRDMQKYQVEEPVSERLRQWLITTKLDWKKGEAATVKV